MGRGKEKTQHAEERIGGGKLETTIDVSFKHVYAEVEQREGVVI